MLSPSPGSPGACSASTSAALSFHSTRAGSRANAAACCRTTSPPGARARGRASARRPPRRAACAAVQSLLLRRAPAYPDHVLQRSMLVCNGRRRAGPG